MQVDKRVVNRSSGDVMASERREEVQLFRKDYSTDRIDKYKWKLRDEPGELVTLNKNQLKVDEAYQRPSANKQVLAIASNWSWIAAGVLTVALRDDGYYVVDGAHRLAAARLRSDITDLPCLVFVSGSVAYEAGTFMVVNTNRKPVSSIGKYNARLAAQDPAALELNSLLARLRVKVSAHSKGPRDLKAISAVLAAYEKDPDLCERVLRLYLDIPSESCISKDIFNGLFYLAANGINIIDLRFAGRVQSLSIEQLVQTINRHRALTGYGSIAVSAAGILVAVNKGLHCRFKMPTGGDSQ